MALESVIIGLIAFSPPILLLYFYLGDREEEFKHEKMVLYMAYGIVIGTVFCVLEIKYMVSIVMMVFLAFFEELTKYVVLNRRALQGKKEAVWYGASMGFMIGGITVGEMMYVDYMAGSSMDAQWVVSFFGLAFSYSAMHGATGTILGYGSYSGGGMRYLWKAFFIHILFVLVFFLSIMGILAVLILVAYTAFNYVRAYDMVVGERFKTGRISRR